jgi:transposase InsO family protein
VGRDCHAFYHGFVEDSVGIRFHLGDCGSTDQGGSLYTCQDYILQTTTTRIVYVKDRGTQFTSKSWETLQETLDTQLCFSSAYQSQTNGQTERVNQILEDMLRACALQYIRSWDKSLPYVEFSYNNSYQESLKMVPFEMLYGHRCQLRCFGVRLGNGRFLDPTFCKKPRSKFVW